METIETRGEIEEEGPLEIVKSGDCWLCSLEQIIKNSKNDELLRIVRERGYEKIYVQICKEHHRIIKRKA